MIIDTHAHIYPDKIALKASKSIESFYDLHVEHDGSVGGLIEAGDNAHIDMFLVHSVATTPEQVERINDFIVATVDSHPGRFVGFCAMHQDYENPSKELERMKAKGIKGVKLHPDFQRFCIDDEGAFPIYEAAEALGMPILFHLGDHRYEFSKAPRLLPVISRFPNLKIIGAHLGGWSEWDAAAPVLAGTDIYVDTSSSLAFLEPAHARMLIDTYGADRVMFASDYPMWTPQDELDRLSRIPMTDTEREMILWRNAAELLNINNQ